MTLHELYLDVKQQVAEAVTAVNASLMAAAQIAQQEIEEAMAAIEALDDYLDYFGIVGNPMNAAVEELLEQLYNLAKALDDRGYFAIYNKTFNAANQYQSAKSNYDGFVRGMGGTSGGGGASGSWGEGLPLRTFSWYGCFNRNGATLHSLPSSTPPPEESIDFTVLLGPCSNIFVYQQGHPDGYWQAGIYQYARLRVWVRFINYDVIFDDDWGETPSHPEPSLSYDYVIHDSSDEQYFQASYHSTDWTGAYYNQGIPLWPYDVSDRILTANEEAIRDVQWKIVGRHNQWDHEYWLYNLSYWEAWEVSGIPDGYGGFYGSGRPNQLIFINPCSEEPSPGKDTKPFLSPILPLLDDNLRKQLTNRLALNLIWLPYELCFDGQKLLWEGEQMTFGDV